MTGATTWRAVAALLGAALLAGCGSDRGGSSYLAIGRTAIDGILRADGQGQGVLGARDLALSDAQLRAIDQPLIKITRERQNLSAALPFQNARGPAATWRSVDGKTVTLYNGLLIATKGFGDDLSSAKVPSVVAGTSGALRQHYYLGGDEIIRRHTYSCSFRDAGTGVTDVVGLAVRARQVVETCEGEGARFENVYWFDDAGAVRKSRQWVSPEIGTLLIQYVPRTGA